MPPKNRNTGLFTDLIETAKLVVDESLQRGNIKNANCAGGVFVQQRENREKGGLGFPGGGGCCQKNIVFCTENSITCSILDAAKCLPAGAIDIVLNERGISGKNIHMVNSA